MAKNVAAVAYVACMRTSNEVVVDAPDIVVDTDVVAVVDTVGGSNDFGWQPRERCANNCEQLHQHHHCHLVDAGNSFGFGLSTDSFVDFERMVVGADDANCCCYHHCPHLLPPKRQE